MGQKRGKCKKFQLFEGKLWVLTSYLCEMQIVSIFYNSSLFFTTCFYHFLFWRYLNSRMTSFSPDILLLFPYLNDLNCCEKYCYCHFKVFFAS